MVDNQRELRNTLLNFYISNYTFKLFLINFMYSVILKSYKLYRRII